MRFFFLHKWKRDCAGFRCFCKFGGEQFLRERSTETRKFQHWRKFPFEIDVIIVTTEGTVATVSNAKFQYSSLDGNWYICAIRRDERNLSRPREFQRSSIATHKLRADLVAYEFFKIVAVLNEQKIVLQGEKPTAAELGYLTWGGNWKLLLKLWKKRATRWFCRCSFIWIN